jgi:N-acetylmuramoyl-L-alanine amidase
MATAAKKTKAGKAAKVTAAPARVTVELKMAMSLASAPGVVRWAEGRGVASATIAVQGTAISATTNQLGLAQLPIVGVVKGRVLEIAAAAVQASTAPASTGHGAGGASAPAFQFRPFQVTIDTDAKGFVPGTAVVGATAVAGAPVHALVLSVTPTKLSLDWKPDFILSANRKLATAKSVDVLVLHRTGGNDIRSALNTFLNPVNQVTPQYLVDVDGHVVKLCHETDGANHVGPSFWNGRTKVNDFSVGIEIVHAGTAPFTDEQYATVLRLVREIRAAHASITRQQVVGHMEVATEKANQQLSSRRIDDPSEVFEWDRFEAANLVRARTLGPPPATLFGIGPGEFAQKGRVSPRTLRPDIRTIQTTLSAIGYSIAKAGGTAVSGVFDDALTGAVKAFQRRYFAGANAANKGRNFQLGRIDFETAEAIDAVSRDTGP